MDLCYMQWNICNEQKLLTMLLQAKWNLFIETVFLIYGELFDYVIKTTDSAKINVTDFRRYVLFVSGIRLR